MAKIQFFCDNAANAFSTKSTGIIDTVEDWGMEKGAWESMTEDEKYEMAKEWASDYIEIWFEDYDE